MVGACPISLASPGAEDAETTDPVSYTHLIQCSCLPLGLGHVPGKTEVLVAGQHCNAGYMDQAIDLPRIIRLKQPGHQYPVSPSGSPHSRTYSCRGLSLSISAIDLDLSLIHISPSFWSEHKESYRWKQRYG